MKTRILISLSRYLLVSLSLCLLVSPSARASTGCSYPTSHDSWVDKIAGDFLTIADVNQFRHCVEKLQSGPLRPSDGTLGAPAYSFLSDPDTGIFRSGANTLDVVTGGLRSVQFIAAASAVNFLQFASQATGGYPQLLGTGADTNVGIVYAAKGAGTHIFFQDATERTRIEAASRISRYVYKTSSESVLDATLQNDNQLVLAVEANQSYYVQAVLLAQHAGGTPNLKIGWTGPAGVGFTWGNILGTAIAQDKTISGTGTVTLTTAPQVISVGGILATGATAGNIQLQWAQQNIDGANATTIQSSSFLTVTKLP